MASLKFLSRYSLCFSICTDCFSSGNTAGQAVRCGIRRALLRGGGHGTAGHPLLAGTDRHCAALLVLDRRALLGVDWGLLVIFAAFFTFSGNMARIEPVRELFRKLLAHGVMPVAALTSQVISNVPAAILLSQFTDDYPGLLVGVNIGGVGTLVASLASLITFREYTKHVKGQTGRFMALFSVISFGFLPA
jgi:Na+/H+ antiporter NhaD/arsenite permease-like protein